MKGRKFKKRTPQEQTRQLFRTLPFFDLFKDLKNIAFVPFVVFKTNVNRL
ncbi:hypothetical protein [Chryseobacterium salivictor]|nr:hypothetical protein [Chryseobacterium salivictor]